MGMLRSTVLGAVILAAAVMGCRRTPSPDEVCVLPAVRVVDEGEWKEILSRHQGQVVLVDYWATWCAPCVERFPHTVELFKRLGPQGLVVMAVSLDDPDDLPGVQRFLAAQGATFENYLSRYGAGTKSLEAFGVGGGGLPVLRIYDHRGRLQKTFGAGKAFEPAEVDQAVTAILERRAPLGFDPASAPEAKRPMPAKLVVPRGASRP